MWVGLLLVFPVGNMDVSYSVHAITLSANQAYNGTCIVRTYINKPPLNLNLERGKKLPVKF